MEIITTSAAETKKLAAKIAKSLKGGEVLALYGELGSGKTTFTQGLASALGIKQRLVSPTFVIHKRYKLQFRHEIGSEQSERPNGKLQIMNHLDYYRLEGSGNLTGIDINEIIDDPSAITIIEWPERIEELLPKDVIKIKFEVVSENERKIASNLSS